MAMAATAPTSANGALTSTSATVRQLPNVNMSNAMITVSAAAPCVTRSLVAADAASALPPNSRYTSGGSFTFSARVAFAWFTKPTMSLVLGFSVTTCRRCPRS